MGQETKTMTLLVLDSGNFWGTMAVNLRDRWEQNS